MNAKTKVLLLDTNDAVGGVVRGHLMFLRYLDRNRFDVHAAVLGHGPLLPRFQAIPEVTLWTMEFGTKPVKECVGWRAHLKDALSVIPLLRAAFALTLRCKRAGIQVIHTPDKKRALLLTLLLHRLTGIPYLYHIHDKYIDYPANRLVLRKASLIIANSGEMRRDFIKWFGPEMERIRLVYNGMDAQQFRPGLPSGLRAELKVSPEEILVGICSRIAPDKGQETFLKAAARVAAEEHRVRFAVVGDDSIFDDNAGYMERLRQMADQGPLAGRVSFLEFRQDMPEIYSGLDILVNAASREAFGLVVVEGMACGKAVIGTNAGGVPEIITHGQDGFLFPVNDDRMLADLVLKLFRDPGLRRTIGENARKTVIERFTIETQVKALEQALTEVATRAVKVENKELK